MKDKETAIKIYKKITKNDKEHKIKCEFKNANFSIYCDEDYFYLSLKQTGEFSVLNREYRNFDEDDEYTFIDFYEECVEIIYAINLLKHNERG